METDREIAEHALAHVEGGPNYVSRLAEACAREARKAGLREAAKRWAAWRDHGDPDALRWFDALAEEGKK